MDNTITSSYTTQKTNTRNIPLKSIIGSAVGTAVPIACMMKRQKIYNPLKLQYGLKDMMVLATTSVAGGVCGGSIGESKASRKNKIKEGVFQILNAAIPTWFVAGNMRLLNLSKYKHNLILKTGTVISSIGLGMLGAASLSNLIFDPKDKHPDRKIKFKDCIVNADELVGALVLAKFPLVENLKIDKLLPLIYTYCGFKAGNTK